MAEILQTLASLSVLVFVVTSMLAMGLSLTIAQIAGSLKNVSLVVKALIANFVLAPLLAAAVVIPQAMAYASIADRSSRMDLLVNEDGSVDIYVGPDAPAGKESNWITTVAGKAWFPYFRLYSPKQTFLDKTWVLPDIEKA